MLINTPLFFIYHCGSAPIKDKTSLEKTHEQAKKGDKQSYENYEKALETAKKENNPELEKMIINDLATIPSKESTGLLKKEAVSETTETRSAAIDGLYEQSKISDNPQAVKNETVAVIKNNSEKYNELTSKEIKVLGEIKSEDSENLLVDSLNKPENDQKTKTEIIESLGIILTDRIKEINNLDASKNPDSEKKAGLELSSANIENSLLDVVKSEEPKPLKESALREMYNAYIPNSRVKFMEMYHSNEFDENTKLSILKILGNTENPENNEILKSLKKEYLKTENPVEHTRMLNRVSALAPNQFKFIKAELEKEMEKIIRKNELKALVAKGQIVMLKTILKKYNIPGGVVDKIQGRTEELGQDKTTPMKAEAVILFSSVREIYPDKNYFELKKAALRGLNIPGLFLVILSSIDKDFASYDMKILTIQSVFKISEADASKIYTAWQNEKDLLRELLH
jgi:hypothetical protein